MAYAVIKIVKADKSLMCFPVHDDLAPEVKDHQLAYYKSRALRERVSVSCELVTDEVGRKLAKKQRKKEGR